MSGKKWPSTTPARIAISTWIYSDLDARVLATSFPPLFSAGH
jgi:hypothetical protein